MFKCRAILTQIGGSYEKKYRDTGKVVRKLILHFKGEDEGLFFTEVRNNLIDVFYLYEPVEGDQFDLSFQFEGSIKKGKIYNNIIVTSITRVLN